MSLYPSVARAAEDSSEFFCSFRVIHRKEILLFKFFEKLSIRPVGFIFQGYFSPSPLFSCWKRKGGWARRWVSNNKDTLKIHTSDTHIQQTRSRTKQAKKTWSTFMPTVQTHLSSHCLVIDLIHGVSNFLQGPQFDSVHAKCEQSFGKIISDFFEPMF